MAAVDVVVVAEQPPEAITIEQVNESVAIALSHGEKFYEQIIWQVENRVWEVDGCPHSSWDEFREAAYGDMGVAAPRSDRPELTSRLRGGGLTQKQISDTLGVSIGTVNGDLKFNSEIEGSPSPTIINSRGQERPATYERQEPESEPEPESRILDLRPETPEFGGDEWYTPQWIFDSLGLTFDLDVCSPEDRTHVATPALNYFTEEDDGLAQEWNGLVWCNPPYSDATPWAEKIIAHGSGLLLSHVPMNAKWCMDVWQNCQGIRLFQGMEFVRPDGTSQRPAYWLQLAAFGDVAAEALARLEAPPEVAENPRRVPSPMWVRA